AWSIADEVLGRDGTDRVFDVDYFQFADTIVSAASLESPESSAPTNVHLSRMIVAEDTSQWTTLGLLSATDLDGDTISFKMIDGSDDHFRIKGNRLVTSKAFDYETQSEHHIAIEVSDGTNKVLKEFEISVADVYEPLVNLAPENLSFSRSSIKENVAIGTSVGLLNAIDPE
ncbi:cadherin repeat domain-containing protein, partial [Neorhizobium galegae]|uniref:cadherin repeat domain-containing protein n=1 Tax=Neorhizobium galegae TaxID=399 RepID=UPI0021076C0C